MDKKERISKQLKMNRTGFSVLMTQVKALQGSHGLYAHFIDEFKTLKKQVKELAKSMENDKNISKLPLELNSLSLARSFFKFISNPHPYPHHLNDLTSFMGASDNIYLKINILERFLHSVDRIDPNFYQNPLHKQEVKQVIIQSLEDLYDQVEEMEEEEELESQEDYLLDDEPD